MADIRENEMREDNNPSWFRALASDGSGVRTNAATFVRKDGRESSRAFRMPNLNSKAVKVASINNVNGYYNTSFFILADSFGISFYGIIGLNHIASSVTPFAKLNVFKSHGGVKILFVENGTYIDVYITGSYSSSYTVALSSVFSMSEYVLFTGLGSIVDVASLTVKTSLTVGTDT